MDVKMKKNLLATAVAGAMSLSLASCGGGGGSDSGSSGSEGSGSGGGQTTTFNINVDAPDNLLGSLQTEPEKDSLFATILETVIPSAYAAPVANAGIKVAIVDANGIVTEIVTAEVTETGGGEYQVILPVGLRNDCLVIAELPDDSVTLEKGRPVPEGALFAPTTELDIDVDVFSTVATRILLDEIDSFDEVSLDEINSLIDQVTSDNPSPGFGGESLSDFLGSAKEALRDNIIEEVNRIQTDSVGQEDKAELAGNYFWMPLIQKSLAMHILRA